LQEYEFGNLLFATLHFEAEEFLSQLKSPYVNVKTASWLDPKFVVARTDAFTNATHKVLQILVS